MTPLSAVLITRDEERNLPRALESVRFCDEVVVVDGGSTRPHARPGRGRGGARGDERALARLRGAAQPRGGGGPPRLGARPRRRRAGHARAARRDPGRWRTRGFDHAGYRIPRVAFYLGRWIRGTDWYPDPQLRLFDRRRGRWQGGLIHESVRVDGSVGRLRARHGALQLRRHQRPPAPRSTATPRCGREQACAGRAAQRPPRRPPSPPSGPSSATTSSGAACCSGEAGLTVSTLNSYYTYVKLAKLRERLDGGAPPRT